MSEREVGWVSVKRVGVDDPHIELTLNVGSFKDSLVINVAAGDWSKMLANPNLPVGAEVRFEPR